MPDGDDYRATDELVAEEKLARRSRGRRPSPSSYAPLAEPRGYEPRQRDGERQATREFLARWAERSQIGSEVARACAERERREAEERARAERAGFRRRAA